MYPLSPVDLPRPKSDRLKLWCYNSGNWNVLTRWTFSLFSETTGLRHRTTVVWTRLRRGGNVETNPGPEPRVQDSLAVVTYNVRGLKDEGKLRHLLNHCHKGADSAGLDCIYLFQETYLETPGKIPYIWRGNYYITAGEGNSGGCLTLVSSHLNIVSTREIEKRAHVLVCQRKGENAAAYIIVNLYAPNPNTREKIEFYERLFELVEELELLYDCQNVIVGGDFNLTFKDCEVRNRLRQAQEKRIAKLVEMEMNDVGLKDVWKDAVEFTWRRPNTDNFSCIDHIFYNKAILRPTLIRTNWSLSYSDHAAIETRFTLTEAEPTLKTRIPRLDPSLIKTPENKAELELQFNEMWAHADNGWDPHTKLEYAKMCIRTVGEKLQAERKRKETGEEDEINEALNLAISQLEKGCKSARDKDILIEYVEELRSRKEVLIESKGERLAEKLGSKWYNEGEKSTKYFLRLLNRKNRDVFGELINNQNETLNKAKDIEDEVVNFYKNLYENYDRSNLTTNRDDASFFNNVNQISGNAAGEVTRPISIADLTGTLHTCKDSAPGPDGIPYSYLGALWTTMGPLICDAWNHSLRTGELCPSHKLSFLRLIPKAGKDPKKLNNWRPITLSNCDHKIITKAYSNRMAEKIKDVIKARQTAYLKGRLINDNIRSIMLSINLCSEPEENIDGLIVSLDAKKAFDSVEHSYIEKCLTHFGLSGFIPIFRVLYSDLRSDILINGKVVTGYKIKRGVKQGDALSCILFIMCMEPLISNIEANGSIESIFSEKLGDFLPKAYTYADDLNCTIKRTNEGLRAIFSEYARLTRLAGLELNADKTELMRFASDLVGRDFVAEEYLVEYLGRNYRIKTIKETKINGILFQLDKNEMRTRNVENVKRKMEMQLLNWSRRCLSTLGKILIVKTFGISQIIFVLQSMLLEKSDFKQLNAILYKFIWNKNFLASKAPERIKREIVATPTILGGYGMLDIEELDCGLKLRALGRLLVTEHPTLLLLRNKLDLSDFFFPSLDAKLDGFVARGVELLKLDRQTLWKEPLIESNVGFVRALRGSKILNVVKPRYKNNIALFMLRMRGKTKIADLNQGELRQIDQLLIDADLKTLISKVINLRLTNLDDSERGLYYCKGKWVQLNKLTSKELREARSKLLPLCVYKCGLIVDVSESAAWLRSCKALKSTAHKNAILRFVHGDIYSKERLFRFGLSDAPECEHCDNIETINHRIFECIYARNLWQEVKALTNSQQVVDLNYVTGAFNECSKVELTIHAELILRLTRNLQTAQLNPTAYVRNLVKSLAKKERGDIKRDLESLLP